MLVDVVRGGERIGFSIQVNENGGLGFKPANLSLVQLEDLGILLEIMQQKD